MAKRQAGWTRIGSWIVHKPHWRSDRGAWYARLRNVVDGTIRKVRIDLPGIPQKSWRRCRVAAQERALELAQELQALKQAQDDPAFEDAVEEFLAFKKGQIRENSWDDLALTLHRIFVPAFRGRRPRTIRGPEIEKLLHERRHNGNPISGRTQARLRAHMSNFFSWAVRHGIADQNPAHGVKTKRQAPTCERVALTVEEARELLRVVDHETRVFVAVSLYTALRPQAVLRLLWADIRFHDGYVLLPAEKSKNHIPVKIPLHPVLKTFLLAELERRGAIDSGAPLVTIKSYALRGRLRRAFARLTIPDPGRAASLQRPPLRIFRRTAATWLSERASLPVLRALLGHKLASAADFIALKYTVPRWEELEKAVMSLPDLFTAVEEKRNLLDMAVDSP